MTKSGLPKSLRKFLRKQKALLRAGLVKGEETEAVVLELVKKIRESYNQKRQKAVKAE